MASVVASRWIVPQIFPARAESSSNPYVRRFTPTVAVHAEPRLLVDAPNIPPNALFNGDVSLAALYVELQHIFTWQMYLRSPRSCQYL